MGMAATVLLALMVVERRHSSRDGILEYALEQARQIEPPGASLMKGGEYEHGEFWDNHDRVLKSAWKEWWHQESPRLPDLTMTAAAGKYDNGKQMMNPSLIKAIRNIRQSPTEQHEKELQDLFQPITLGVHSISWFTPQGVWLLRQHLDAASYYYNKRNTTINNTTNTGTVAARIPTRRPNGMNRYGIIIDPKIEGAVSYEGLNTYMEELVEEFVRPLGRMLFPEVTSRNHPEDDCESYAFTIRYHPDEDMELKEHSDASIYTININLNLVEETDREGEGYEGSTLYFVQGGDGLEQGHRRNVTFTPGMAVLHRGIVRHGSYPITTGERHNLVIWLFGQHGYVRVGDYPKLERLTTKERWSGNGGGCGGRGATGSLSSGSSADCGGNQATSHPKIEL